MAFAERIRDMTNRAQRLLNKGAEKTKAKAYTVEGKVRDKISDRK